MQVRACMNDDLIYVCMHYNSAWWLGAGKTAAALYNIIIITLCEGSLSPTVTKCEWYIGIYIYVYLFI